MNPFLDSTLAAIREEAEATRPLYMALAPAVAELVAERVERGILSRAEAVVIFDHLAAEYHAAAAHEADRDAAAPCRCPGIPGAHAFKADGCNFGPGRFRFHARY